MKHWCLALVALGLSQAVPADSLTGRVVGISDGDTIVVLDAGKRQHRIRLTGIDAPEKAQPIGQAAKKHLSDLIFDQEVVLQCTKVDRYRRQLCTVLLAEHDINKAQVAAGMAWWYRVYSWDQTPEQRVSYERAELAARNAKAGLWADLQPTPPWEWRRGGDSRRYSPQ